MGDFSIKDNVCCCKNIYNTKTDVFTTDVTLFAPYVTSGIYDNRGIERRLQNQYIILLHIDNTIDQKQNIKVSKGLQFFNIVKEKLISFPSITKMVSVSQISQQKRQKIFLALDVIKKKIS